MATTAPQSDEDFGIDSRPLPDPDPGADADASDGGGVSGRHRSQVAMQELGPSNRDEEHGGDKEQIDAGDPAGLQDEQVSVDSLINGIGFGAYQRKLLVLCGAGWAADIMDLQVMAFLLPHLNAEWGEPMSRLSLAPSGTFVGMLLGSLVWGVVSDTLGRKQAFAITSLWAGVFGMLCSTSSGVYTLVLWRFLMGFGLGGNLAVDFSLFMEFVPTSVRGKYTVLLTIFATLGSLTTSFLAWVVMDTLGWRTFVIMCSSPGVVVAILRSQMHESPHFLAGKGRTEEAHRVLAAVALANGSSKPDNGIKITSNVLCGNSVKDTVAALGDPAVRGRLIVMACSWFALSFGFYGFSVWGPSYFAARGFQRTGVYQAITLSVVCQLPGTAVAALLVERVGRRLLLIAFSIGCTIAVSGVALFTSNAGMVVSSLFLNFFTAGLWAVTYTHTPEVFPTHVRTTCMGVCSCIARIAGIIVSLMGGFLLSISVESSVMSYAVAYACVAILSYVITVDMSGRDLSVINTIGMAGGGGGGGVGVCKDKEGDGVALL